MRFSLGWDLDFTAYTVAPSADANQTKAKATPRASTSFSRVQCSEG